MHTSGNNLDEQLKNISPESIESFERAQLQGRLNFIKNSPLKYVYIAILILFVFFAASAWKRSRDFSIEQENTRQYMQERRESFQNRVDEMEEKQEETTRQMQEEMMKRVQEGDPRFPQN